MKTRVKKVSELLGIIRKMDRRKYFPFLKVVYENQPHIVQKLGKLIMHMLDISQL